jgi:hypothetical protein
MSRKAKERACKWPFRIYEFAPAIHRYWKTE